MTFRAKEYQFLVEILKNTLQEISTRDLTSKTKMPQEILPEAS